MEMKNKNRAKGLREKKMKLIAKNNSIILG